MGRRSLCDEAPAAIPELSLEIYSRCIVCRMNEEGKLEIWDRYLIGRILPENTFAVARAIKKNAHYLSNAEIGRRTGLEMPEVTEAIEWLIKHKVIQQDRRSIRAGHQVSDEDAYFFTTESWCAKELIAAMAVAKDADQ